MFFSELRAKIDIHFGFNCFLNKIGTFALRSIWKAVWNSSIREHTALTSYANSHIKNSTTCVCFARNNVILSENCFLLHVSAAQVLILLCQEPALCGGQRKSITVFLCGGSWGNTRGKPARETRMLCSRIGCRGLTLCFGCLNSWWTCQRFLWKLGWFHVECVWRECTSAH